MLGPQSLNLRQRPSQVPTGSGGSPGGAGREVLPSLLRLGWEGESAQAPGAAARGQRARPRGLHGWKREAEARGHESGAGL